MTEGLAFSDPLDAFLNYVLSEMPSIGEMPFDVAVRSIDGVTAVTWLRYRQFQVQMFICPPHHVIPEHTHPNVDSYEVYVGGQIRFSHSGRFIVPDDALDGPDANGLAKRRGWVIRVRPDDLHGGVFGEKGGVFLSVQHWLNGVAPHCVSADYDGAVMGPDHLAGVVNGNAFLPSDLTARQAASKEVS